MCSNHFLGRRAQKIRWSLPSKWATQLTPNYQPHSKFFGFLLHTNPLDLLLLNFTICYLIEPFCIRNQTRVVRNKNYPKPLSVLQPPDEL